MPLRLKRTFTTYSCRSRHHWGCLRHADTWEWQVMASGFCTEGATWGSNLFVWVSRQGVLLSGNGTDRFIWEISIRGPKTPAAKRGVWVIPVRFARAASSVHEGCTSAVEQLHGLRCKRSTNLFSAVVHAKKFRLQPFYHCKWDWLNRGFHDEQH